MDRSRYRSWFEDREQEMIERAALQIPMIDRDDFEAEMVWKVFKLKRQRRHKQVQHWKAYLGTLLRNEVSDWLSRMKETIPIEESTEEPIDDALRRSDPDLKSALKKFRNRLRPEFKRLLDVLPKVNWNHSRAAILLGIHRNTERLWMLRIRREAERRGLGLWLLERERRGG